MRRLVFLPAREQRSGLNVIDVLNVAAAGWHRYQLFTRGSFPYRMWWSILEQSSCVLSLARSA
jgi:hypothetical protein